MDRVNHLSMSFETDTDADVFKFGLPENLKWVDLTRITSTCKCSKLQNKAGKERTATSVSVISVYKVEYGR